MALIMIRGVFLGGISLALFCVLVSACGNSSDQAQTLFEEGRFEEAIAAYDKKLESGNNLHVRYNRTRALEESGKVEEAEQELIAILEEAPDHLSAKLSLSKLAYEKEDYVRSIMLSGDAIHINENSAKAHYLQARAKHQLGYSESAMKGYDMVISLDKNFGEAYLYRGALKQSLKKKFACEDFRTAGILKAVGAKSALERFCD